MRGRCISALCIATSIFGLAVRAVAQPEGGSDAAPSPSSQSSSSSSAPTAGSQPPPPPKLVPPRQLVAPPLPYPAGGEGDAIVVVRLTVDETGAVTRSEVEDGREPFASAARDAVRGWRFSPATRDGAPIAAVIRARIAFHPDAAPPIAPPPKAAPSAPPKVPPKPAPQPAAGAVEVVVEGERTEIGQSSVSGAEIRLLPGAFGDPFRMIEALPGVVPIVSGLPFFYVRGAPPGNTGYFIDGVRVPMLFHLGAGPSIVAPALIDRVDFWPGGYPARFGRYTGGVVAGETTEPLPGRHGEYQVRLFDASAMVETPLDDGKTDALVAGRYGYPGLLLSLISPDVALQYWDYQLRVGRRLSARDRISAFVFGAFDRLDDKKRNKTLFNTQFHRADLRWDRALTDGAMRVASTFGFEQSAIGDDSRESTHDVAIRNWEARLRLEVDHRLSSSAKLRGGADLDLERHGLVAGPNAADAQRSFPSRTDAVGGVWLDVVLKPARRVELVPGVRFDVYGERAIVIPALDPRLATRIALGDRLAWISSFAVVHQPPAFFVPVPGLQPDLAGGLQQSFQASQGVEVALPWKTTATVTGFRHVMLHLTDFLATCLNAQGHRDQSDQPCSLDDRATGTAIGLEFLIKRALTERLGGWVAYTLSRADRTFRGVTALSQFDRPHVLALVASYDLGDRWRVGGRFSYLSGRPVSIGPPPGFGPQYAYVRRLPDFYRIDLRLEKKWVTSETSWTSLVFEFFNATLKKEATDWSCSYSAGSGTFGGGASGPSATCVADEIGPISIPSIGVEGGF